MSPAGPNPYPGPRAFEEGDGARFFGRATEIRQLRGLAVARRVVLLYAPSGAGKSSLLSAGLVPHLRKELPGARIFPIARVSGDPPAGISVPDVHVWNVLSAILEDEAVPAEIAGLTLRQGVDRLLAGEEPAEGPPPAFLILDQLEELFNDGRGEPRTFFEQLREALEARPELSLLLALREEALAQLDPYKVLLPDQLRTRYRLDLLSPEAARQAIKGPAEAAGIPFAPGAARRLVDDLRRSLAESPEGAAREGLGAWVDPVQLQVVCHRIWASLPDGAAEIDEARAHAVGSFDEILARHYDEQMTKVARETGVSEKALRRWIDHLVTPQGLRDQVGREPEATRGLANRAVEALVDTHLVRGERRRGMVWYELAHDRLVRPVRQSNERWQEVHRSLLERQADLWVLEGRPRRRLLPGREAAAAEARLAAGLEEATGPIRELLDACRRARRRRVRLWWQTGLGIALALVAALAGFSRAMWEIGVSGAASLFLTLENQILLRRESELDLALLLGVMAKESEARLAPFVQLGVLDSDARRLLFQALEASPHLEAFLPVREGEVSGVAFSADSRSLTATTTAGAALTWDVATHRPRPPVALGGGAPSPGGRGGDGRGGRGVRSLTLAGSGGGTVIEGGADGTLLFRHPGGTASPLPRDAGVGPIALLAASPDGEVLAVGGAAGRIALWDVRREQPIAGLTGKTAPLRSLAFSPDGAWLASGHERTVVLWRRTPRLRLGTIEAAPPDAAAGPPPQAQPAALPEPLCPGHLVTHVSLSKGPFTAAGCSDGTLRLNFRTADGPTRRTLSLSPFPVQRLALSADTNSLAAATADGSVWLVDVYATRLFAGPLRGHRGPVNALAFEDPDGLRLVSTGTDGRRIRWNLDPVAWRRIACDIAGRDLTAEEITRLPYAFLLEPVTCSREVS